MFTACNELRGLSLSRLNYIIVMTMGLSLLSYLILGLGVYWTFGSYTLPDFLRNYPLESPYVVRSRIILHSLPILCLLWATLRFADSGLVVLFSVYTGICKAWFVNIDVNGLSDASAPMQKVIYISYSSNTNPVIQILASNC